MRKTKEITCMNCEIHHEQFETQNRITLGWLRSIPKSTLRDLLLKIKFIKYDYDMDKYFVTMGKKQWKK